MISKIYIESELDVMEKMEKKLKYVLKDAPNGSVYFRNRGGKDFIPYWDRYEEGKRVRTPLDPNQEEMLKRLKYKTYAKRLLPIVSRNIRALQNIRDYMPLTEDVKARGGAPFQECRDYFFGAPVANEYFDQMKERQNPSHPEELIVSTELGVFRSKLEYIVARILTELGLRFKYEAAMSVGTHILYPDFTVLHPKTGKLIYIEAAGLVNNERYRRRQAERIESMAHVGIYLGVNLFVIGESPDGMDTLLITNVLRGIFGLY